MATKALIWNNIHTISEISEELRDIGELNGVDVCIATSLCFWKYLSENEKIFIVPVINFLIKLKQELQGPTYHQFFSDC